MVGPLPPPVGGVETMTQAVLESRAFDDFERTHVDITKHRPKETQGRFDLLNFVWAARHLARMQAAVRRFRPHVAYVPVAGNHSAVLRDLALAQLAHRGGARVLGHQHAGDIHRTLARGGVERRLLQSGFAAFDRMLVLGEHWRPLLAGFGVRCPIHVVPSTFRREVFERAARAAPRPPRDTLNVLFVGHYGRGKGTPELLQAVAQLAAAGVRVRATIVGPPQRQGDAERVRELRATLPALPVTFTGALAGEPLWQAYEDADLFVLPSHAEGLPVVLHEAGAFGLPVVTTPVGAIPELIRDGANGLLVPPGNVTALAAAIGRLAREPALAARLGGQLRHDVGAFHPDRVCARIADHARALLAAAPHEAPAAAGVT